MIQIFSYLSDKDLNNISLTCGFWRELQNDNDIWSNLYAKKFQKLIDKEVKEFGYYREIYFKRLKTRTNWYQGLSELVYLNMSKSETLVKGNIPKS
jgi:hypothetical protein